jgi:secreted trypsin-like serine protease
VHDKASISIRHVSRCVLLALVWHAFPIILSAQNVPITQPGLQRQIIGGREATRNAWPWLAALVQKESESLVDGQFCGASLIHPWWVLTATHCLVEETADSFSVVFKAHNLANDPGSQHRIINVAEIFLHPAYETAIDPSIDGDIALIRLAEPIYDIPPIPLATSNQIYLPGTLATVAGWGLVMDEGEPSDVIREVELPIVSLATAEATGAYESGLLPDMLAAGFPEGGKDSCQGDSGGPLMVPILGDPGWAQVGIVSFGSESGCAAADAYGIYSRISYYYDDIMTTIHPGFTEWSSKLGISGFLSDPDRDGRTNFHEYSFGSNPLASDTASPIAIHANDSTLTFSFQQRANIADAILTPEFSTNLIDWTPVASNRLTREPRPEVTPEVERITVQVETPPGTIPASQFMRLRVSSATDLPLPRFTTGAIRYLGSFRESSIDKQREFILGGAPVGTEVGIQIVVTGGDLVPLLKLLNHETNELLQEIQSDANQSEIRLTFTPEKGIIYRANLSSTDMASLGTYKFNFPPIPEVPPFEELTITPNQTVTGELTEEDAVDPLSFWDDYILVDYPIGSTIEIQVSSKPSEGGFHPLLLVFDATTEEFVAESPFQELTQTTIRFQPNETSEYIISVTNLVDGESGPYDIQVNLGMN